MWDALRRLMLTVHTVQYKCFQQPQLLAATTALIGISRGRERRRDRHVKEA
jgi:hypothetical protein